MKKIVFILTSFAILFSACEKLNPENAPLKIDTNIPANTITIDGNTVTLTGDTNDYFGFEKGIIRDGETFNVTLVDGNVTKEIMTETKEYQVIKESGLLVDFTFKFNVYDINVVKDISTLDFMIVMTDMFRKYKYVNFSAPFIGQYENIYDEFEWYRGTSFIINDNKLRSFYIADMSAFMDIHCDEIDDYEDMPLDNDKFVKGTYLVKELNSYAMNITGSFETANGISVSFNVDFMTK